MGWFYSVLVFLLSFAFMEFAAWFSHKYIMHGFMWFLHESHHKPRKNKWFELNDLFAVFYAAIAITLIYFGLPEFSLMFWAGLGITAYGFSYFMVHDVFVHQRFKLLKNVDSVYFKALRKAHKIHHKVMEKDGAEAFGFLFVTKKYYPKETEM
jgi:beta-carotene 3-hydroxylase